MTNTIKRCNKRRKQKNKKKTNMREGEEIITPLGKNKK